MKINSSLRLYLLAIFGLLALAMAVLLSLQSGRHFLMGIDLVDSENMVKIAETTELSAQGTATVLDYHVSDSWQNVPEIIKTYIPNPPTKANEFIKKFYDWIYFAPPGRIYMVMLVETSSGEQRYVSRYSEQDREEHIRDGEHYLIDPMVQIVLVSASILVLFILIVFLVFKAISKPVESLQQWATNINIDKLQHPVPDFQYSELNGLATIIHSNLTEVNQTLEREQEFLRYASHELRTPIAIIRSNSAFLDKIHEPASDKEQAIRERIQRASLTMKDLTETLLWLSREQDSDIPTEQVNISKLIKQLTCELSYLLESKPVTVDIQTNDHLVEIPLTPCRILIANLVRNAYQHTCSGNISIIQQGNTITITNTELENTRCQEYKSELGFGLGMKLVEKLCARFNWHYLVEQNANRYIATVTIKSETA